MVRDFARPITLDHSSSLYAFQTPLLHFITFLQMRLIIPNCQRLNRGHLVMKDLVEACKSNDITDLIILHETRGKRS